MKPIIFTGDSFTFGEGLELHDDMYRPMIKDAVEYMNGLEKQGKQLNFDEKGYWWHKYCDFSENIVPAGSLRYELSYAAIVSKHFKTLGFRKFHNGGNQTNAVNFINQCTTKFNYEKFSIAIINLTSPQRDSHSLLQDYFKKKYSITFQTDKTGQDFISHLHELFIKWSQKHEGYVKFSSNPTLFYKLWKRENPFFGGMTIESADKLQNDFNTWDDFRIGFTTLYYEEYIRAYVDTLKIPYYFIEPWNAFDTETLDLIDNNSINKTIKHKIIPLYKDNKITTMNAEDKKNNNFYLHNLYDWSGNHHPSKYGHQIIADSIIKFINENNLQIK
jgi:hypothetical protein